MGSIKPVNVTYGQRIKSTTCFSHSKWTLNSSLTERMSCHKNNCSRTIKVILNIPQTTITSNLNWIISLFIWMSVLSAMMSLSSSEITDSPQWLSPLQVVVRSMAFQCYSVLVLWSRDGLDNFFNRKSLNEALICPPTMNTIVIAWVVKDDDST